jgi:hypothetical protein
MYRFLNIIKLELSVVILSDNKTKIKYTLNTFKDERLIFGSFIFKLIIELIYFVFNTLNYF